MEILTGFLVIWSAAVWFTFEGTRLMNVCPIWSDTLNELMDADVDVLEGDLTSNLGPASVNTGSLEYGSKNTYSQKIYADRRTQKRLREYIARKRAIKMFDQVKAMQS